MESHAVIEAERIVNAYLDDMKLKSGHAPKVRAKKKRHRFMYVIISAVIAAVITAVKYFLF